jgi:hypothetical protein
MIYFTANHLQVINDRRKITGFVLSHNDIEVIYSLGFSGEKLLHTILCFASGF